jgi:hypothetical protein
MITSENHHAHVAQMTGLPDEERQIEATLAVAYEQRTANMIALYTAGGLWRSAVKRAEFGYAIKERLGATEPFEDEA